MYVVSPRYTRAPVPLTQIPSWIPNENRSTVAQLLGTIPEFEGIVQWKTPNTQGKWKEWLGSSECESTFPLSDPEV
jgi:hypothetical protein